MVELEVIATTSTPMEKSSTTILSMRRNWSSVMLGKKLRSTFSANVTEGASRVADEHDRIAASSAPKNMTCTANGAWSRISRGRMYCESLASRSATIFGSIRLAEYARNIGTNAKKK